MYYIIHRLEWTPCLLIWVILLFVHLRALKNENQNINGGGGYNYKSFAEATSISSIQKLVDEHCMTDIKVLCNPNFSMMLQQGEAEEESSFSSSSHHRHHHARCTAAVDDTNNNNNNMTFDPPFIILLDSYMNPRDDVCEMAITDPKALSSSEVDTMKLVIHYTLKEAYNFSRLYFRVKQTGGSQSSQVVNHDDLRKYVFVLLNSFVEYFSSKQSYSIYDHLYFYCVNNNHHYLTFDLWDRSTIRNLLTETVYEYENGNDNSLINSDVSHDKFFLDCFLSKIKDFLQLNNNDDNNNNNHKDGQQQQQQKQMMTTVSEPSSWSSVVPQSSGRGTLTNRQLFASKNEDEQSDDPSCLEYYRVRDSLITQRCSLAMDEATIRVKELSIFNIQGIYTWMSWFALVAVFAIIRIRTSRKTTTTKAAIVRERAVLRQLRQFLIFHTIISIFLIIHVYRLHEIVGSTPTTGGAGITSPFSSMALLSLSVFLATYMLPGSIYFCNESNDDDEYYRIQQQGPSSTLKFMIACELPLINESSIEEEENTA